MIRTVLFPFGILATLFLVLQPYGDRTNPVARIGETHAIDRACDRRTATNNESDCNLSGHSETASLKAS